MGIYGVLVVLSGAALMGFVVFVLVASYVFSDQLGSGIDKDTAYWRGVTFGLAAGLPSGLASALVLSLLMMWVA